MAKPRSATSLYQASDWARLKAEAPSEAFREEWRRDYARIIHSPSFRRLQGKTQLFPGHESDFFRNRLTHSLEVAQIAESICHKINSEVSFFSGPNALIPRVAVNAALLHDIGHPPFGHNGEKALDEKMLSYGGFEGNAQTVRIAARLEKKLRSGRKIEGDSRIGLNLTNRTLAAILKYDRCISSTRVEGSDLEKGYYASERKIIENAKKGVVEDWEEIAPTGFKTIECGIMDLADDIAYSTYDLEDSLKAGFLTPASILAAPEPLLSQVARRVTKNVGFTVTATDALQVFIQIFGSMFKKPKREDDHVYEAIKMFTRSSEISRDGYLRTLLTSDLIREFIGGVRVIINKDAPPLSQVYLETEVLIKVETLKHFTYEATISSSRLKISEYRGKQLVSDLFDALTLPQGTSLLPDDVKLLYESASDEAGRMRVVCDFIAGMTDRYAIEFHGRLNSDTPQSMFKPI